MIEDRLKGPHLGDTHRIFRPLATPKLAALSARDQQPKSGRG